MPSGKNQLWGLIGLGHMGKAIAKGVRVAEPDLGPFWTADKAAPGADFSSAAELLEHLLAKESPREPATIVLAVKPQSLAEIAREIRDAMDARSRVVVSILAGTPGEKIRAALGPSARVVRAMPNLPAQLLLGCTAVCTSSGAYAGDEDFALELFRSVGKVVIRTTEDLMDAFTAVVGSGPAYIFYLAEAMTKSAIALGFDEPTARRIVTETITGAGQMLAQSPLPAESLRAAVTSKAGTTAAAIEILDHAHAMDTWLKALTAARDRGRELSKL